MSRRRNTHKASVRSPQFGESTTFIRTRRTVLDLTSVMETYGPGLLELMAYWELKEQRDMYDSDEEKYICSNCSNTQTLTPHPQITELDDEEAEKQTKELVEEEEKRKSKAIKNKRKKMRKKEKKRQEREESDRKVLEEDKKEEASLSESEEETDNNYEELGNPIHNLSNEPYQSDNYQINQEEIHIKSDKEQADSPMTLDPRNIAPFIPEKAKKESEENEKTPTHNKKEEKVNATQPKKGEEPIKKKSVGAEKENEEKVNQIKQNQKVMEYAEEDKKDLFSESKEEEEEKYNTFKEMEIPVNNLPDEQHKSVNNKSNHEEIPLELDKEKAHLPRILDPKSLAKSKAKKVSEENGVKLTHNKKEEEKIKATPQPTVLKKKCVKAEQENKQKVTQIPQSQKEEECAEQTEESVIDDCTKKSRELAGLGNHWAANGQYEMAIQFFTKAIKYSPQEYRIFGNRSFCFEKLQRFEEALSDANISLSLEPNWTKGLFRKGKALCGLKKYNDAALAFAEVLKMENTSQEAAKELKRAQTLHLMEMGFSWSQCTNALKNHTSLEEAIDALFNEELEANSQESGACMFDPSTVDHSSENEEWERVGFSTKPKQPHKEKAEQQYPTSKRQIYPWKLFPVWVGSLSSTVSYATLHEVFSRVGRVFSVKMVLEHHCAFVNYTTKTDCERAIQLLNGFVLEGCPLSVQDPSQHSPGLSGSKHADPLSASSINKECFFWRTNGCTKDDCTFKHIPQNKGIDKERFGIKGYAS